MQGLAVVLFPVLLMLFALAMERVEFRLSRLHVREEDVAEFLETANDAEVRTLAKVGLPDALARLQRRRAGDRAAADPDKDAPRRRAG
jgi:hypothetical protein